VIGLDGTLRSFGRGTHATWSPTRDRLAYIGSASGFLTVIDPDGQHRWTLRTPVSGAFAWSPGGRQIAFLRNQAGSPTLFLARPGSPKVSRVITLPAAGLDKGSYTLSWSGDGRWLAATTDTLSLLVRTDGTGFQAILGGSALWAPSGHTLVFVAPNGSGTSLQTWPTPAVIDQAPVGGYYEGLAWSPDGTRLIFARGGSAP
jgi:Tol biopolymer transport system component